MSRHCSSPLPFLLFLLVLAAETVRGNNRSPIFVISTNGPNTNWPEIMFFPDANETPRPGKILGQGLLYPAQPSDVSFVLYTRRAPRTGQPLATGNVESLKRSTFNSSQPTFLITHGFLSNIQSSTIQDIKNMYLGFKEGNVIAVDWSRISSSWLYFIVKRQTVYVGGYVANFVNFLVTEGGASLLNIHMSGHSLGAHVMGIAGKNIQRTQRRKVGRITGLDPAGPLFSMSDVERRLDKGDAYFVDVIHTCGGWLGFRQAIGHVDFFPNGGTIPQPGCPLDYVKGGTCSHSRSWKFFAESINSFNFVSLPCENYREFLRHNCNYQQRAPMGEPAPRRIAGQYFLKTAASPPFALG